MCGLVHDIGKVARLHLHPEDFCKDVGEALYQETGMIDVSEAGTPAHDILGQVFCKEGLNKDVESVIRWHHEPEVDNREDLDDDELNNLVDIVMVGNWLAHSMSFGFSGHRSAKAPPSLICERLCFDEEQLDFFKQETGDSFKDFENFLKLVERSVV